MNRRDFMARAMAGSSLALAAGAIPRLARAAAGRPGRATLADAHIEILTGEPIGTIAPEIYGHFTEHLGGVIYDGVWVGEGSKIPNVGGIRKALVDAMQADPAGGGPMARRLLCGRV